MDCSNFLCCFTLYCNFFSLLQNVVSHINNWYDFTNMDSVSITLVFITIITLLCGVYNLLAFFKKKFREDEGTVTMWDVLNLCSTLQYKNTIKEPLVTTHFWRLFNVKYTKCFSLTKQSSGTKNYKNILGKF